MSLRLLQIEKPCVPWELRAAFPAFLDIWGNYLHLQYITIPASCKEKPFVVGM